MTDWKTTTTSRFIIYGLVDPRTGEIRYIGKSSTGMVRPRQHGKRRDKNQYKSRWIQGLRLLGLDFSVIVIAEFDSDAALDMAEVWAIAYAKNCGMRLTNLTEGGSGGSTRRGVPNSPETRARISAAKKGIPASPAVAERLRSNFKGRKHSPETIEKMKKAHTGRKFSVSHCQRMSEVRLGKKPSPETRKKLSDARKRVVARGISPLTCQRISAALSGRPKPYMADLNRSRIWTDEMRARASRSAKNRNRPRTRINLLNGGY